jgi:hypothetical protein
MKLESLALLLIGIIFCGCQTPPKFEVKSSEALVIQDYKFTKQISIDVNGSQWQLAEIRPSKLPYNGKIADLSAEDRWLKMFKAILGVAKEECGTLKQIPEFRGDELYYDKLGFSPEHPKFIQAKFMCQ